MKGEDIILLWIIMLIVGGICIPFYLAMSDKDETSVLTRGLLMVFGFIFVIGSPIKITKIAKESGEINGRYNATQDIGSGEKKIVPIYTIQQGDTTNIEYKLIDND